MVIRGRVDVNIVDSPHSDYLGVFDAFRLTSAGGIRMPRNKTHGVNWLRISIVVFIIAVSVAGLIYGVATGTLGTFLCSSILQHLIRCKQQVQNLIYSELSRSETILRHRRSFTNGVQMIN